ncbi:hypothetical protein, partial [Vibrio diabolicus]|uniref:hypothetical protein n=1 Tax=Vibrio diabolicus TaxID=50719 RepID=UPI0035A86880
MASVKSNCLSAHYGLYVCYQNENRRQDSRVNFAIIIKPGNQLQKGEMMAITIRDTSEHEKMLSDLKEQTNTSTMSKALIKGGYDALRYKELYLAECDKNKRLREKLYDNNQAVSEFLDALDGLKQ